MNILQWVEAAGPHSTIWYSEYTRVVNIKNGFPPGAIYVGRAGYGYDGFFGNPFTIGKDGTREQVLKKYDAWLTHKVQHDDYFRAKVYDLRGKTLVCFCVPEKCHAMSLAIMADNLYELD